MNRILLTCAGLVLLFSSVAEAQTVTRVLIVGDSWAEEQWDDGSHAYVFAQNDLSDFGIYGESTTESGSTAFDWKQAEYLQLVDQALDTYPDIDTVQLTVGGNDFLNVWHTGMTEAEIETLTNAILFDLGLIIDYILSRDPGIEVLLSLYDYPNFRDTLDGLGGWFACEPRWQDMGQPTPLQLNLAAIDLVESIANIATANQRVHYVDHFGLMQNHYGWPDDGIPPGSIEPPGDINEPSPYDAMRRHAFGLAVDCFHLRPDGYDVIVQNLIDRFLAARMHGTAELALGNLDRTYDGSATGIEVTTMPPGLEHTVTYDGNSQPPSDAGSYTVVATIDQSGWAGQATETLHIAQAEQTIEFAVPSAVPFFHPPISLEAGASSGMTVEFTLISGPASLDEGLLSLDGEAGTVVIEATQTGNNNWLAAEPAQHTIQVLPDAVFHDDFGNDD